jgi:hypothetical protein
MTAIAPPAAPRRFRAVRFALGARLRRRRIAVSLCLMVLIASAAALVALDADDRVLAAPMAALALTTVIFVMFLWQRDGVVPIFESGTLCMLAIALYGIVPLIGFLMMQGQWTTYADNRLFAYPFIPGELAAFGWRYAVYGVSFMAAYLIVRGRAAVKSTAFQTPNASTEAAVVIVFAALYAGKLFLKYAYGYDLDDVTPYIDPEAFMARVSDRPHLVGQIGHNIYSAVGAAQEALLILLLAHWRKRWCRIALLLWLAFEVGSTAVRLGSRGAAVLLLLTAGVLYHRLVKPVKFLTAAVAGAVILSGFLILGVMRGRSATDQPNPLTASNEFQSLFTTALDLHHKKIAGTLNVPWQIYVSDLYMPIPSQFLPFEKMDPSAWYIDVIGATGQGVGFMFGVLAQAAVGLDWIELVLRGVALAVVLALLHRWYVRNAVYFWPTLVYVFLSIWTYTTIRASTFYFLYFVVYQLLPVMVATKLIALLLSRARGGKR